MYSYIYWRNSSWKTLFFVQWYVLKKYNLRQMQIKRCMEIRMNYEMPAWAAPDASQSWLLVEAVKPRMIIIASQAIVMVFFFLRLENKDLQFLLHVKLETLAEQYQLVLPPRLYCYIVRNQVAKQDQLALYI